MYSNPLHIGGATMTILKRTISPTPRFDQLVGHWGILICEAESHPFECYKLYANCFELGSPTQAK